MGHSSPPSRKSTLEPPAAPREDPGRLTEKANVVIGIVVGILGALLAVGFELLPASTVLEKSYIVIASLALSIAAFSGIGAWKSGRRFAFTATSTGLAIICLAGLSVAAQARPAQSSQASDPPMSSTPDSTQPNTASPTTKPSASVPTANPSPASSPGTPGGGSQSLIDMTPVPGSNSQSGQQTVDGQSYQQTLYDTWDDYNCDGSYAPSSTTYNLDYKYRQFRVVVGLSENSPPGDTIQFSVLIDNQEKGVSPTLQAGQTQTLNLNVAGAYRITLQDNCTSAANAGGNNVTAVWINPVVKP